ncbi:MULTISPECIES: zinc ABC transporter ATPase [Microbacterium]|uniref:Zinc ABC transporter ATPase n=1 Tax=Microbacterium flavum TaxID=415216 RepID=A0ABS5XT40_9MICO|nr:zinc ABC transporter ATPase [Microbacterium flavum]MBT8797693.1 zinc ABC transporter ATPase [Microbacterium flavum]
MDTDGTAAGGWEEIIRGLIARATETAPTEPGVYRMPCGECVVDFFITAEGEEHWLVAGDERSYTRETVAIARHGDHPWERLYTLADAAEEIARLAAANGGDIDRMLKQLVRTDDDREVERRVREREGDEQ